MQHIDDGLIHAWLDDALDAAERARVNQHITRCAECKRRIDEEREIIARASDILAAAVPPAFEAPPLSVARPNRPHRRNVLSNPVHLAWAASIILALGFGWLGRSWLATEMTSEATIETLRTSEPAAQTDAAPPSAGQAASLAAPIETAAAPAPAPPSASQSAAPAAAPARTPPAPVASATAPVATPPAATSLRAQAFAADEWVGITVESAERESGMPLLRLDGAEIVDVAVRRTIGRVELRTRQRPAADTTMIEFVQMRELAVALSELALTGAVAEGANRAQQDSAHTTDVRSDTAGARAERARREAAAAQRSVAPAAKAQTSAVNEVTVARDGMVITARASMPQDSLNALLRRIR